MSTSINWQPVASIIFDQSEGDTSGTVVKNLEKMFYMNFPMTLTYKEHFDTVHVMSRMQSGDNSIYHQICNALQEHHAIIIDIEV